MGLRKDIPPLHTHEPVVKSYTQKQSLDIFPPISDQMCDLCAHKDFNVSWAFRSEYWSFFYFLLCAYGFCELKELAWGYLGNMRARAWLEFIKGHIKKYASNKARIKSLHHIALFFASYSLCKNTKLKFLANMFYIWNEDRCRLFLFRKRPFIYFILLLEEVVVWQKRGGGTKAFLSWIRSA